MLLKRLQSWLNAVSKTARRGRKTGQRAAKHSFRAQLERLEDRTMPAVFFYPALSYTAQTNNTDVAQGLASPGAPAVEPQITVNPTNPANIVLSSHGFLEVSTNEIGRAHV